MIDFANILDVPVLPSDIDVFWAKNADIGEFSGKNQVIFITTPFEKNTPKEVQLKKIIDACSLQDDAHHIITAKEQEKLPWTQIKEIIDPGVVVLFGVTPLQLGISALFSLNSVNSFDGANWIPSLSLEDLEKDPAAKKELWMNALKPLFADK